MCLAVPGRIESIFEQEGLRMARMDFGGVGKEVCLAYLPEANVGDYAIVHAGFAIQRVDEQAACETLRTFAELGLLDEELAPRPEIEAPWMPETSSQEASSPTGEILP